MERKSKRESMGSVFESFEIPRKRLRVEYLDEASSKEINMEDLLDKQTVVEEVNSKQTETTGKHLRSQSFHTPVSAVRRSITNKQMRNTANRDKDYKQCSPQTSDRKDEEEVMDKVLVSMKDCFEEVSKLLKAKDQENKLLKRSMMSRPNKNEITARESESEIMLRKENANLSNELRELKAQKKDCDANENLLRDQNKKLRTQVDDKTAYIENILEELVSQSKEMNGLHAKIRTLLEEKSRRKNDEKGAKVWPCISVKPLSELTDPTQQSPDNILDDILIPIEMVGDDMATDSIVRDSETESDSDWLPGPDVGLLQQNPANSDALGGGECIKSKEEDDLPDVLIDKVVAGREEVKVENCNAIIDEELDEEEREIAELQRIIDEEEQREKELELDPKDAESESVLHLPRDKEMERGLEKEKELEKAIELEKETELGKEAESMKESELEAEYIKWKEMEKENYSRSSVVLSDEGGREDDLDGSEELNDVDETDTLAELLEEEEVFEDVLEDEDEEGGEDEEDEEDKDEEWDEMDSPELEEVEREENHVFIASESPAALEEEVEEAIVIPTDKEELELLNLFDKENDTNDINPSWLDCPLCYSSFLKVAWNIP